MLRKLMLPLDRSPLAEQAIGPAAAIARASHASLDVMMVHEPLPGLADAPWNEGWLREEDQYLEILTAELTTGAGIKVSHAILRGDPTEMICARAVDIGADLIVMTSHGRTGLSRAWSGSVADGVLRRSGTPVLMLRPQNRKIDRLAARHLFNKVLVPLDGSALSAAILPSAMELATCGGGSIALLQVVHPVPLITADLGSPLLYIPSLQDDKATEGLVAAATHHLADVAQTLRQQGFANVETDVVVSPLTAQAIIDYALGHGIEAVAMSTHGRGASRLFMGSVADKVRRGCQVPVLLHRPPGISGEIARLSGSDVAEQLPALSGL